MTNFRRYDHLVRFGAPETAGIDDGIVYVFPKLDGTNASAWLDEEGRLQCGSRNRVLSIESDNAGFCAWANSADTKAADLRTYLAVNPKCIVYGEWLVPHTVKTYREDAWRRFWIFDVFDITTGRYVPFDTYATCCVGLDVIEPLCTIDKPSINQLIAQVATNTYLVQDGHGAGEGIVIKRYDWSNGDGKQPWAKLVRNEFKERNRTEFGTPGLKGEFSVEAAIAEEFCTPTLVGKTRAKVVLAVAEFRKIDINEPNAQQLVEASFRHNVIPQLLGRVWHDFITEEIWAALKKHNNPTIDFARLNHMVTNRTKALAADLFGGATVGALVASADPAEKAS